MQRHAPSTKECDLVVVHIRSASLPRTDHSCATTSNYKDSRAVFILVSRLLLDVAKEKWDIGGGRRTFSSPWCTVTSTSVYFQTCFVHCRMPGDDHVIRAWVPKPRKVLSSLHQPTLIMTPSFMSAELRGMCEQYSEFNFHGLFL